MRKPLSRFPAFPLSRWTPPKLPCSSRLTLSFSWDFFFFFFEFLWLGLVATLLLFHFFLLLFSNYVCVLPSFSWDFFFFFLNSFGWDWWQLSCSSTFFFSSLVIMFVSCRLTAYSCWIVRWRFLFSTSFAISRCLFCLWQPHPTTILLQLQHPFSSTLFICSSSHSIPSSFFA